MASLYFWSLQYGRGHFVERNFKCERVPSARLAGNVMNLAIDDVGPCHRLQVAHTAADAAMEQEDVALHCECRPTAEISVTELIKFIMGEHVGSAIDLFGYFEFAERTFVHEFLINCPHNKRSQFLEIAVDRILATFPGHSALGDCLENLWELLEQFEFMLHVVVQLIQKIDINV